MKDNGIKINFCSSCGAPMEEKIPVDDDHIRAVCTKCPHVQYENPKMVVGCIPIFEDKILLCKRNIEPRKGKWTLPAGYLENKESVQDGAVRETLEETGAHVQIIDPYRLFNIVFVDQIYLMFRAELGDQMFGPTSESCEVRLFTEAQIPWDEIAFEVIRQTLVDFFLDRKQGAYSFKIRDLKAFRPGIL
ncbi:MAG: NUDIX hydrolase [Proteobacteria bacterium]|nr:NUDIX hydrolase [Pseudomonadota bacterium]MBU4132712.1 NUDIX hydrolase [Pseudomonadota bacterium]